MADCGGRTLFYTFSLYLVYIIYFRYLLPLTLWNHSFDTICILGCPLLYRKSYLIWYFKINLSPNSWISIHLDLLIFFLLIMPTIQILVKIVFHINVISLCHCHIIREISEHLIPVTNKTSAYVRLRFSPFVWQPSPHFSYVYI